MYYLREWPALANTPVQMEPDLIAGVKTAIA